MLENELFALLKGTTDAAFSVTEEGEILSWNKAAEKLLGYSATETLHETCYEVLEGMGALGTRVCHQHCSVAECTGGNKLRTHNRLEAVMNAIQRKII